MNRFRLVVCVWASDLYVSKSHDTARIKADI